MAATPTGHRIGTDLRLVRSFDAPIGEVWAAITESDRLARWIGYYEGEPASGSVGFFMTAESDDPASERVVIEQCSPPDLLLIRLQGGASWRLKLELAESGGATSLTFTHVDVDPAQLESIGPGWDFYLDRLSAAMSGGDVAAIDFDADYYPAMAAYYRAEASRE